MSTIRVQHTHTHTSLDLSAGLVLDCLVEEKALALLKGAKSPTTFPASAALSWPGVLVGYCAVVHVVTPSPCCFPSFFACGERPTWPCQYTGICVWNWASAPVASVPGAAPLSSDGNLVRGNQSAAAAASTAAASANSAQGSASASAKGSAPAAAAAAAAEGSAAPAAASDPGAAAPQPKVPCNDQKLRRRKTLVSGPARSPDKTPNKTQNESPWTRRFFARISDMAGPLLPPAVRKF